MTVFKKNLYFKLLIFAILFTMVTPLNLFANTFSNYSVNEFTSNDLLDIKFCNNVYVTASDSIYASKDGKTWEPTFSTGSNYTTITVLNNEFIATGENVQTVKSSDGLNWSPLRLHKDISLKKIFALGKTYFWINPENELLYSYNLFTWTNVPMPSGQKILNLNFANNKCFLTTGISDNKPNYFVLSEDLTLNPSSIKSIENIYYIAQTNNYIQIVNPKTNYLKELQILISTDGEHWEKSSSILPNSVEGALNSKQFDTMSAGGKLFLNLNDTTYTTSDGLNYEAIKDYGNFKNIQYSGKYFYSTLDSNNLYLSEDGITWYKHTINQKAMTGTINVFGDTIFLTNPNFDLSKNKYTSKLYSYLIPTDIRRESIESIQFELLKFKIGSSTIQLADGSTIETNPLPSVEENNTLIALRPIITGLQGTLTWEASTNKITVYCNNKTIELWINSTHATIDGEPFTLPIETKSINNKTVIAIRPIIENLGYTITWLDNSKEIIIKH